MHPEHNRKKVRHPTSPEVAQCGFCTVITICLERCSILTLGDFLLHFGSLLGSFWALFGKSCEFGAPKWGFKKTLKKVSQKVMQGKMRLGVCGPLKEEKSNQKPTADQQNHQRPRTLES